MKLTIGMAVYDDPQGVLFSMQSLRLHHAVPEIEFLVVDNKPDALDGDALRTYLKRAGIRYIPAPELQGTSAPRERVFREAIGDAVLCIDAHVLLAPGAVEKLIAFYDQNPDCRDLLTGPMLGDGLDTISTHYNLGWRGEMFGMWGTAWRAPNGEVVSAVDDGGMARFVRLPDGATVETYIKYATTPAYFDDTLNVEGEFGRVKYSEHAQMLREAGFTPLGWADEDDFQIPAMGLGLFSCRRDAWVGFHPEFKGFGGAEQYIHEKFRQRGNCTRSLGFLKWWHRFAKIGGIKYPVRLEDKLRNTIIAHQELGLPLDDVRRHFVEERKRLTPEAWDKMVTHQSAQVLPTLDDLYERVRTSKGTIEHHMPALRAMAEQCQHVTEFTRTKGSTVAFAAGLPSGAHLVSCNTDANRLVDEAAKLAPQARIARTEPEVAPIDDTDLLFLGSGRDATRLTQELESYTNVRRWIVLHDIVRHAAFAPILQDFVERNPKWFVRSFDPKQGGLVVLSRDERDRPEEPIYAWPPGHGPGTELKKILESLGIQSSPTCDCRSKASQMDLWGVEGCRENRETIIEWMRAGQGRWGWKDKLAASAKAVTSGLAFKLNPLDLFPSLIDEAIRRAEVAILERATKQESADYSIAA
jgi:hypothetical protein